MPQVDYPAFKGYPQFLGLFVGGCVERGDGSSFRRKAHSHCVKGYLAYGWICVRSVKRLYIQGTNRPSLLMWHELAHLLCDEHRTSCSFHSPRFKRIMRELSGGRYY